MTQELTGWMEADYDDSAWHNCKMGGYEGKCIPQEGEAVLEHERFAAKVLHTPNGKTVLDFGQNLAGHVEFTVTGSAGHTVELHMGECLDEEGNFTTKNIQAEGSEGMAGELGQNGSCTRSMEEVMWHSFQISIMRQPCILPRSPVPMYFL